MLLGSAAVGWLRVGDAPQAIAASPPPPPPPPPPGPPIVDQVGPDPVIFWGYMLRYEPAVRLVISDRSPQTEIIGPVPAVPRDDA
jgi:hypothetical protein